MIFCIVIYKACRLYTNLTNRWYNGIGTRILDGTLVEVGEFPWMVTDRKIINFPKEKNKLWKHHVF